MWGMRHGSVSGYTNNRCRCDACRAAMRDYQKRRALERRLRRTTEEHGDALAALAALDRARARGAAEEASPPRPRAAAAATPARLARTPVPPPPLPPPPPALAPTAPHAPSIPMPLTIGATGRWHCGHEMTIGVREATIARARGLSRVPCPICGAPGLVAQLQGDTAVPIAP